ncbi:MAG: hypothetical protein H7Y07_11580 [Pyrinomonadaceae bacterium]|nr:hypothetical protein [Sphingobacteriaceae bacterium]
MPLQKDAVNTILLKKGVYRVSKTLNITHSGIVIMGEGNDENGTVITFTSEKAADLFDVSGTGKMQKDKTTKLVITDAYFPVGSFLFM